jgi:hypothetical protein
MLPSAFQNLIELQRQGDELAEVVAKLEKDENVSKYSRLKGVCIVLHVRVAGHRPWCQGPLNPLCLSASTHILSEDTWGHSRQ